MVMKNGVMKHGAYLKAAGGCLLLVAFATSEPAHAHEVDHGTNARGSASGRSVVSVDVYAAGETVDVLTGETSGAGAAPTLWHRRSIDAGKSWSKPVRVGAGMPLPH